MNDVCIPMTYLTYLAGVVFLLGPNLEALFLSWEFVLMFTSGCLNGDERASCGLCVCFAPPGFVDSPPGVA